MLNESIIEKLTERLVNRIEEVNSFTLKTIGEQINRIRGMTPTNAQKLLNVLKYGGDLDKIANELARVSNLNIKDIYTIFEEVAKNNYNFSEKLHLYKNINFIPYEDNISLKNEVKALARATAETYFNLSNTTGFTVINNEGKKVFNDIATTYVNTVDKAVLNLTQGKDTFYNSMRDTIKELGSSGIKTVNYESGYSRRLDSSVRMNIMSAIRDLHNTVQNIIGEQVGTDGIEISVHTNPAEDHQDIQGKQFSNEDFERLNNTLARPISTLNCYHYIFNIILGVSEPRYTDKELKEIIDNNNKGFEFEDKHYTNYQGQQLQRQLEVEIRKQKDIHTIAKASGDNKLLANTQGKIREFTNKYKELSDTSGLPTKLERLQVEGYKRVNLKELK